MKRLLMAVIVVLLTSIFVYAQGPGMRGPGRSGGYCPFCGQGWGGSYSQQDMVPEKLTKPKNEEWINRLKEVLVLETLSKKQYEANQEKFQVYMPYMIVIPQENDHIVWISQLFTAYGLSSEVKSLSVEATETLDQAYERAKKLEADLFPHYEWLIENAEDDNARQLLNTILLQTRIHYTMFDHVLRIGGRIGPGMMWW